MKENSQENKKKKGKTDNGKVQNFIAKENNTREYFEFIDSSV
jgi:hypothetical protein